MGRLLPSAAPSMVEEWEADRRAAVAGFDRLMGKGHTERRAAARLGLSVPCTRALQATFQRQRAR